jgi:hypothetical protein
MIADLRFAIHIRSLPGLVESAFNPVFIRINKEKQFRSMCDLS